MTTKRILLLVAASLLAGCASQNTVMKLAARDSGCDRSNIAVTELEPPRGDVTLYQTVGCGTTHNYLCPTWASFAKTTLTLGAMAPSVEIISIDDPLHCVRQKR